jgi:two-component system sensor histidine kinase KdpD
VLHRLDPLLVGREIAVDLPATLPMVHGDEVLLGQVFVNLLENAIKYTPAGSPINIVGREVKGTLQVDVRDHGPGLPADGYNRLFEKFYRSSTASAHGAGLGLAISKAVVQVHGGTIEAFNHPSGGAVFRLHLPMRPLPVEQPA